MTNSTMTIIERDAETTKSLINDFAIVCMSNDTNAKRAFARRIITIYRNDATHADLVNTARAILRNAS